MAYERTGSKAQPHHRVNHALGEYVRGQVTTNHPEGYFAQPNGSLAGTFYNVSVQHLSAYLAEFDYRWSARKMSDSDRLERLIDQSAGRRLMYQSPTE